MQNIVLKYAQTVQETIALIASETESMDKASTLMAEAIMRDELIHVIGPGGHSNMAVEEVLWRAGGLACVNGILDAGTNVIHGAKRSNIIERCPGYGIRVMDAYGLNKPGEVVIIVNAYGINSMTIDVALESRKRGLKTIAITSDSFAKIVPPDAAPRHPSGLNLYENVDVYVNNHLPVGDACIELEGVEQRMGPMSTYCNCFAIDCLMMKTAEKLIKAGVTPPIWTSGNLPGGDEANKELEEKYFHRVKHLM